MWEHLSFRCVCVCGYVCVFPAGVVLISIELRTQQMQNIRFHGLWSKVACPDLDAFFWGLVVTVCHNSFSLMRLRQGAAGRIGKA